MFASLLGPNRLMALREADNLPALVELLRHTSYAAYIEMSKDKTLSPQVVESALRARLAADYSKVLQSAPFEARRVLAHLYRRYEVNDLKAVLRALAIGSAPSGENSVWDRVHGLLAPANPSWRLLMDSLAQTGSIAAAVELLRGTAYFDVLESALRRYSSEQSLFPLEVALDLQYWRQLWEEVRKLAGQDRAHAQRVIGALVDMTNLLWAVRYRIYRQLSEEELINYTLPFGLRVRDADIRAIAGGGDIASVVGRAYPQIHDAQALLEEPKNGLPLLEMELKRHTARQCAAAFLGDPFHVGVALAYLVLLDLEIQDLTVLTEAKNSQLPEEDFSQYLTWSMISSPS